MCSCLCCMGIQVNRLLSLKRKLQFNRKEKNAAAVTANIDSQSHKSIHRHNRQTVLAICIYHGIRNSVDFSTSKIHAHIYFAQSETVHFKLISIRSFIILAPCFFCEKISSRFVYSCWMDFRKTNSIIANGIQSHILYFWNCQCHINKVVPFELDFGGGSGCCCLYECVVQTLAHYFVSNGNLSKPSNVNS